MKYELVEASAQAKAKIKSYEDKVGVETEYHNAKYPLRSMKIGQSFAVPFTEANESSLRSIISSRALMIGKKYALIKHTEHKCFEVARIA